MNLTGKIRFRVKANRFWFGHKLVLQVQYRSSRASSCIDPEPEWYCIWLDADLEDMQELGLQLVSFRVGDK